MKTVTLLRGNSFLIEYFGNGGAASGMSSLVSSLVYDHVVTPVGTLTLGASATTLHSVTFGAPEELHSSDADGHPVLRMAKQQLEEYFAGVRRKFELPLSLEGTAFQKRAWAALQEIPYGQTVSYQDQACMMGEPSKCRAVGSANGKNPICVIVPCHRVVRKQIDNLGGYGGGLHVKKYLLDLECAVNHKSDFQEIVNRDDLSDESSE